VRAAPTQIREWYAVIKLQGVRIEQISARLRERQIALAVPKINGLDEPLVSEMMDCTGDDIERLLGQSSPEVIVSRLSTVIAWRGRQVCRRSQPGAATPPAGARS
jgi:hypothetical protein